MSLLYPSRVSNSAGVHSSEGFSLVEVLVSVLMIVSFLAIAMQTLIAATAIKVKSEEISDATTWMQDDLEAIKFQANRFAKNDSFCGNYANELVTQIGVEIPLANPRVNSSGGRAYLLTRSYTPQGDLLGITHEIFRDFDQDGLRDSTSSIGELYSEVIPDAAFACP